MGGGEERSSSPNSLSSEYVYLDNSKPQSTLRSRNHAPPVSKDNDEEKTEYDGSSTEIASITLNDVDNTRKASAFKQVLGSYSELQRRSKNLTAAKSKILRYYPGAWVENLINHDVPRTTTLLLVGPKGSGKSSLVNRISRVFDHDEFGVDRAQVSYNSSGEGTCFLQGYSIPRGSESIRLFDSRSLSDDSSVNMKVLEKWMTEGVKHGDPDIRVSDSPSLKSRIYDKELSQGDSVSKKVNFVIFVVNGLSVLKSMDGDDEAKRQFDEMILTTFECPFLSFRDDKPVIAVTHGDLLSFSDRARVRVYLGDLLGIHPTKQIFDISAESSDPETDMAIVDMLCYALEHADRNLSGKQKTGKKALTKVSNVLLGLCVFLVIAVGIFVISGRVYGKRAYSFTHVRASRPCTAWDHQSPPPMGSNMNHCPPLHNTKVDHQPPPPDTNQPPPPDTKTDHQTAPSVQPKNQPSPLVQPKQQSSVPPDTNQAPPPDTKKNHQTPPPETVIDHQPPPRVQPKKSSVQPRKQSSVRTKKQTPPTYSKEDWGRVRSWTCFFTGNGAYACR